MRMIKKSIPFILILLLAFGLRTHRLTEIPPGLPFLGVTTLQYTASATFEQGNSLDLGDDIHTVTYTITDQ